MPFCLALVTWLAGGLAAYGFLLRGRNSFVGFQAEFLDGDLAHLVLLHLAGDGKREILHELDVVGDLESSDLALAEIADLVSE